MSIENGKIKLLDIMTAARQEADMVNSKFITEPELVTYIQNSFKDLLNLLITLYGNDYYAAIPTTFTTVANQDKYDLPDGTLTFKDNDGNPIVPPPFYKLLGVDLQLNANNPQGYITLKPFTFSERNRFAVPNFASFWGFTNIRYRLLGNQIWMTPVPMAGQNIRLYYVPRPDNLINTYNASTTAQSTTITLSANDMESVTVGMNVFGSGILPNTTVVSKDSATTATMSLPAQGTLAVTPLQMFDYNYEIDGIAGYEEYIIIDAAIKMKDKEESDVAVLAARKAEKTKQINDSAENRDPGSAARTADVLSDIWNNATNGNDGYSGR